MKNFLCKVVSSFSVILLLVCAMFAQTNSEQGIKLYNQGDFNGAIKTLKGSKEIKDLYYIGLAYEKASEIGNAKDAFKNSFARSYNLFLEKFIEWQKSATGDSKRLFSDLLQETKEDNVVGLSAAEKAYELKSDIFQINEWRIKAKVLFDATNLAKAKDKIYSISDKSVSNAKITERALIPFPKHSDGAPLVRRNQSPNKPILIKVFMVFGADGKFKLLMPTDEIVDIYTAQVLNGIEKFKFQTATKDGTSVAYHAVLQYSFTIR